MGDVYANGLEISGKAVNAKTIAAMPDVCFTPPENPATPPGVPIPYPSFGMADDSENGTGTVFIGGKTVNIKNKSDESKTSGTEAGCAAKKGVITSKNTGKKYFNSWSSDVKFDGEPVIRFSDLATHNHASPIGNAPPWPEIANLDLGQGNCVAILASIGLNIHKHGQKNKHCNSDNKQSDHVLQNRCFTSGGRTGYLSNWPNYTEYSAPCVCLNDGTVPSQEHGRKSLKQNAYAKRWRKGGKTTVKFATVKKNNMDAMKHACKRLKNNKAALDCLSEIIDIYFMHAAGVSTKAELNAMDCSVP